MLTVALAKGRTLDALIPMWQAAKLPLAVDMDESRALVFDIPFPPCGTLRFLLAKPADVPTYVSFGVADIGVVGKDVIWESGREVYELLDLHIAKCQLCVAGRTGERTKTPRRVATKYPRLAEQFFRSRGEDIEVVTLGGSIELAAVIGLCDRIFDLVQTGETLSANGLVVFDEVHEVSARLIANRASYRTKRRPIDDILKSLQAVVLEKEVRS